jgi:hypothetical protein
MLGMFTTLPGEILELAQHCGALLDGPALASVGVSRATRETLVRRGLLIAIARGMYTVGWLPAELPDWTWFALRSKAFALASAPDAIAAGWSAVALHDLPTLGRPPQLASVFRAGRPPRGAERCARGWTRFASVPEDLMTEIGGVRVLSPAAAAVDVGRRASRLAALVVADGVARRSATSELLGEAASRMWRWPRVSRARWAVARADPDCETPLETVGRFAIITGGLPTPRSNVWIGVGRPRYRWDHYWPEHRLGVEGDGIGTYGLGGHPTTRRTGVVAREGARDRGPQLGCQPGTLPGASDLVRPAQSVRPV